MEIPILSALRWKICYNFITLDYTEGYYAHDIPIDEIFKKASLCCSEKQPGTSTPEYRLLSWI